MTRSRTTHEHADSNDPHINHDAKLALGAAREEAPDISKAVDARAVAHLFDQLASASMVNVLLAALVAPALWGHAPAGLVAGWTVAVVVVSILRLLLLRWYRRTATPTPTRWRRRFLTVSAISGLIWGLAAPLFVPVTPSLPVLALVIALAGLAAGALPNLAVVLHVYLVFLGVTLMPLAITYFQFGDEIRVLIGAMTILYAAALATSGRMYNHYLRHAYELTARLNEANRDLDHLSRHDPLSGLKNRATLESTLHDELERSARYGSPCALIMLDIDYFKRINDTHGHEVGDRVIFGVAERITAECRRTDDAARWGGEEFMLLLPETSLTGAQTIAERLRRRIAESEFDNVGPVTASLGVAVSSARERPSALLKRVDDALYTAKQNGRNRVEAVAMPETTRSNTGSPSGG